MGKRLAGVTLIRLGIALDYCFEASINSMKAVCDHVYVVYCESGDGTLEVLEGMKGDKMSIILCSEEQWASQLGRHKLSYFQNIGLNQAQLDGYEYCLLVQADECLGEQSIPLIQQALELGEEGYMVSRHNLWGSVETVLNVPQNRKPCSTVVSRLAKSCYRSYDDGESISAPASLDFINRIDLFHMGFVRDSRKHADKIREIQGNIFQMDVDHRVKDAEKFDPWIMGFDKSDVIPLHKPLPVYLNDWIEKLNK